MFKKLLELITGDDNLTLEPSYLWSGAAVLIGLGLEVYSVVFGKPFDFQAYGIGAAALLAGLGLSAKFGK
ncbi:hypothetical protein ACFOFO_26230 [Undibacterium arcticum]|uniref:Uncharacterized protein n=1 Tax=Undibacterium arcticum TaxID=1762892 RepID=A0ABV7F8N1_9BURK